MRMLVTGGAGFIGSHYVRSLLTGSYGPQPDLSVTVLDALTYAGNRANLDPVRSDDRLRFVHGDMPTRPSSAELMPGHEWVVNFAAESHVDRSIAGPAAFVRTNVLGTQVLLEAARCRRDQDVPPGLDRRGVRVDRDRGPWTEDTPLAPSSPYSASKAAADLVALAYAKTFDLPVIVTRGANTYGPYQYPEKLVPLFVTNLLDGVPVPLYGDGLHRRDWLHVDDHCRGIHLALTAGRAGQVYHVGGGTELSNRELTDRAGRGGRGRPGPGGRRSGPPGPRPPLPPGHHAQRVRARLPAAGRVRRRAGLGGRLVPGEPPLVGAAQAGGREDPRDDAVAGDGRAPGCSARRWSRRWPGSGRMTPVTAVGPGRDGPRSTQPRSPRPCPGTTWSCRARPGPTSTARRPSPDAGGLPMLVNAEGAQGLCGRVCRESGARLLHLSTDYVFDGTARTPYPEDAEPGPAPRTAPSKLAGERAVLAEGGCVVRTAWLHDGDRGRSFVATMAARARAGETASRSSTTRSGSPPGCGRSPSGWSRSGSPSTRGGGAAGQVLHLASAGETTWFGLAQEVYRLLRRRPRAGPPGIDPAELTVTRPAPRPAYSVLADTRSGLLRARADARLGRALAASLAG